MASKGRAHIYESSFCGAEMQNVPRNYGKNFYHGCTKEPWTNYVLYLHFSFFGWCGNQWVNNKVKVECKHFTQMKSIIGKELAELVTFDTIFW